MESRFLQIFADICRGHRKLPAPLTPHIQVEWEVQAPTLSLLMSQESEGGGQGFFLFFNWRLITLQYYGGFCHTSTWINHRYKCVPHPDPLSHLPPHPIPQGHPSAPALSTLDWQLNLDWQSVSHMIIYMFQCRSLKSSQPRLHPQSTKACSLHLCLFCYLAYRVITIFLNSIYMH